MSWNGGARLDAADVGAGAIAALLSAGLGFVVVLLLSFVHRMWQPWALVGCLAVVAALLVGLRLLAGTRIPAIAGAVGAAAGTVLAALPGADGVPLIRDEWPGYVWAFGPAVIGIVAAAWPGRKAPAAPPRIEA